MKVDKLVAQVLDADYQGPELVIDGDNVLFIKEKVLHKILSDIENEKIFKDYPEMFDYFHTAFWDLADNIFGKRTL